MATAWSADALLLVAPKVAPRQCQFDVRDPEDRTGSRAFRLQELR